MIRRFACVAGVVVGAGVLAGAGQPDAGEPGAGVPESTAPAGSYEVLEDGSLMIEGILKVPGKGTKESPFVLDWGLLVSAQRVYEPREGKTELPAWAAALEGKRVRITGNLLLPLTGVGTSELLIMQNQWDGCCIGVPPTPYDAIEVRLEKPLDTSRGAPTYGALEGVFKTDPYIVADWLLGLYLLEGAKTVESEGRAAPGHGQMHPGSLAP